MSVFLGPNIICSMDQACIQTANFESGVRGKRTARGYVCFPRDGGMEGGGREGNRALSKNYLTFQHDKVSVKPHRKQKKAICLVKSNKVNSNF